MNKKHINELVKIPLTDGDLERFLSGDTKNYVLKYSELKQYQDLEQLLPHHHSYKIILIEYEKNKGHWICLMRYNNVIEIFNSFGTKHDEEDFVESNEVNYYLGQAYLHLNILIEKEIKENNFTMLYNKIKFQKKSTQINTCGRHVVNRLICLLHYNMSLKKYIKFMKDSMEKTKLNYDELVSLIIQ